MCCTLMIPFCWRNGSRCFSELNPVIKGVCFLLDKVDGAGSGFQYSAFSLVLDRSVYDGGIGMVLLVVGVLTSLHYKL